MEIAPAYAGGEQVWKARSRTAAWLIFQSCAAVFLFHRGYIELLCNAMAGSRFSWSFCAQKLDMGGAYKNSLAYCQLRVACSER
ncbi:MAG: hypothetical protein ACLU5G_05045 [Blautia sp.]